MISAFNMELVTKRRRFCPAKTAADEAPSSLFISLLEGQLRHTRALLNGLRHLLDMAVERMVKHQNLVIAKLLIPGLVFN